MAGYGIHAVALVGGVLTEILIFCRGEWDLHSPKIVRTYIALQLGLVGLITASGSSLSASVWQATKLSTSYLVGLFGAIVTYRLFFHPLRSYPGPLGARISALWIFKKNYPDLMFYRLTPKLHEEYGDFVRIRPRELSICHPDAVMDIHGPKSKIRKGEFYDQQHPYHTLQMTRDHEIHRDKRRIWDKAFSTKALQNYEPRVMKHYTKFLQILSEDSRSGNQTNVQKLLESLGFDVTSDLTFGEPWNVLETGEPAPVIKEFLEHKKLVGHILILAWIFHSFKTIPGVEGAVYYWVKEYSAALEKRGKMENATPDFYTHLSQAESFDKDGPFDAQLALVAGTDSVAYTLTNIMWMFAQYPEWQTKLRNELGFSDVSQSHTPITDQELASNQLLGGFINEILRLYPPVPTGLPRLTPPEGAMIAGRYIPGNINVIIPTYTLHRDKRAFVHPEEFIPERWISKPELILRRDAFTPFGYGPYNCTGRPLAYMQLRLLVALVLQRFDVSVPPGKEAEMRRYMELQSDCFVMALEPLPLLFKERK